MERKDMKPDPSIYIVLIDAFIKNMNPNEACDLLQKVVHDESLRDLNSKSRPILKEAILSLSADPRTSSNLKILLEEGLLAALLSSKEAWWLYVGPVTKLSRRELRNIWITLANIAAAICKHGASVAENIYWKRHASLSWRDRNILQHDLLDTEKGIPSPISVTATIVFNQDRYIDRGQYQMYRVSYAYVHCNGNGSLAYAVNLDFQSVSLFQSRPAKGDDNKE
ncbi:hypothetical protein H5410_020006 [Solanum commersonii]|uniref:Uncharacterized protein n=1 Tax=Solanum commersonii TaxID=4109 RepID=A0A9J5Z8X7_SOLCO|nr:hypothetical protein H5410_020006 [Solanum commersonii]